MSETDDIKAFFENPDLTLIQIRQLTVVNDDLINRYQNSSQLLSLETRNSIPNAVFDETKDVQVINLADSGHNDDDHFLSLFHPETIDRAHAHGFKDVVLEAGDITNMTDFFDEYVETIDMFKGGQSTVQIEIGDETHSFNELEYRAHFFGVIANTYGEAGHLDYDEASRLARALMETIEYASERDIRVHAVGAPMQKTYDYILNIQNQYEQAQAIPEAERLKAHQDILAGFGDRSPIELFVKSFESVQNPASRFFDTLSDSERDFVNTAFSTLGEERRGGATINHVTADTIENIINTRKAEGFSDPKVLHMHGLGHFIQNNDIEDILDNKGIRSETIGFSGSQLTEDFYRHFNEMADPNELPEKWFFAPTGQYVNIDEDTIRDVLKTNEPEGIIARLFKNNP